MRESFAPFHRGDQMDGDNMYHTSFRRQIPSPSDNGAYVPHPGTPYHSN